MPKPKACRIAFKIQGLGCVCYKKILTSKICRLLYAPPVNYIN